MQNLRTLQIAVAGAIVLSASYALIVRDQSVNVSVDSEDGSSIRHVVNGERGEFRLKDDERILSAKWRGDFDLAATGDAIAALEDTLEIELEENGAVARAVLETKADAIETRYFLDGEEQPEGAQTDAAIAELVVAFMRASGVKAEARVEALIAAGGTNAVLAEIGDMDNDNAIQRYAVALSRQAEMSDAEVGALAQTLKTVESDGEVQQALSAIIENQTVSAEVAPLLLDAARGIEGDHDMRKLLETFAEGPLNAEAADLAIDLYARIDGDYDLRKAAEALLENDALTDAQAARILATAADRIDGDHDMRLVLSETALRFSETAAFTEAWLAGFDALQSSNEQRLSIEEAAEGDHPAAAWAALIERTEAIGSDHDRRLAMQAIAERIDASDQALAAAYRAAAEGIGSDHDRRRALEALEDGG